LRELIDTPHISVRIKNQCEAIPLDEFDIYVSN